MMKTLNRATKLLTTMKKKIYIKVFSIMLQPYYLMWDIVYVGKC